MKKALITGIRGQDGAYLAKLLLEKGYEVYGGDRRCGQSNSWRLKELGIEGDVRICYMDLLEVTNIMRGIERIKPDEVYNLAAQSSVQFSFEQPLLTLDTNAMGVLRLLEAIKIVKPHTKFYQASSSEMFGEVQTTPQNEKTPFSPRSPYAASKLCGHWISVNNRESHNIFACSGILFNHESPLRGPEFIARKLTDGVARIKYGLQDKIAVGNLAAKRDRGYAPEYVEAIWRMLQQRSPDDYVIATGETHSVREFTEIAFRCAGFDILWEGKGIEEKGRDRQSGKILVEVSTEFMRPADVDVLVGDYSKAKERLGWQPLTKFEDMISIMVDRDMKRVRESS